MKCTFIGSGSDETRYNFWDTKSHQVIRSRDITFMNSIHEARSATDSSNLTKPIQKSQSPGGSSNTSEVSENSGSFEDSRRSIKNTLKTEHPPTREAPRLHMYENPLESPGLHKEFVQWKNAINEEMVSLEKNQTCSLVREGKKASQSLRMFRVKEERDGRKRYKARLVVKGFQQKQGVDYNEIFSLVVKMTTIRLVLSIVATENLHLEQLDVKTSFLYGDLC
ncbi:retrovirus-related pol polyprotein from transposon TNT 1-94 [Tanacetum coccineum]